MVSQHKIPLRFFSVGFARSLGFCLLARAPARCDQAVRIGTGALGVLQLCLARYLLYQNVRSDLAVLFFTATGNDLGRGNLYLRA